MVGHFRVPLSGTVVNVLPLRPAEYPGQPSVGEFRVLLSRKYFFTMKGMKWLVGHFRVPLSGTVVNVLPLRPAEYPGQPSVGEFRVPLNRIVFHFSLPSHTSHYSHSPFGEFRVPPRGSAFGNYLQIGDIGVRLSITVFYNMSFSHSSLISVF